jgi:hypothetical protein
MKLEITPLTQEGMAHVIANMTQEDHAEIIAAGIDPLKTFTHGMEQSKISGAFSLGDKALAVFGCMADPRLENVGIPWMIATDEFRTHPRDAAELTMAVVEVMQHHFPTLHNLVHCDHAIAQRWLSWCGFQISEERSGPGNQFHYFARYGDQQYV